MEQLYFLDLSPETEEEKKERINKKRRERKKEIRTVNSYKDINILWANQRKRTLLKKVGARKKSHLPFTLTGKDVLELVPKDLLCPVYKIPFVFNVNSEWNLSFDRIDNNKGYTRDNVVIVSHRVNQIKNIATIEEMYKVADFYYELKKKKLDN